MHVSPFHSMNLTYDWLLQQPGEQLAVHMTLRPTTAASLRPTPPIFGATLSLRREPITGSSLARALARFPLMSAQVIAAIHWQALRLWMKGVPVHDRPPQADIPPPGVTAAASMATTLNPPETSR